MRCKHTAQGAKDFYEEHIEDYQEARDEEFDKQFRDFFNDYLQKGTTHEERNHLLPDITEDDIQGFLDSFTFPDEDDWIASEYEGMLGDCADQAYEEYKDRQMGL